MHRLYMVDINCCKLRLN